MGETLLITEPNGWKEETQVLRTVDQDRDWINGYRQELDGYYHSLAHLNGMAPDEVFMTLSALSARASEIRSQLVRVDSRRSNSFRTQEIDKFIEECDRQFRVHSRLQAIREMEARMTGGFA